MDAKELRIGNYVDYERTTHIVSGIELDSIKSYWIDEKNKISANEYDDYSKNYEPIPITKDWLMDLSSNNYTIFNLTKNELIIDRFMLTWKPAYNYWYITCDDSGSYLTKIEFVHEWQNFFFVMNGKQLIKG